MANRTKSPSAQVRTTQQALAALARHADRRKWSVGQQLYFIFSCGSVQALHAAVDADSDLARCYEHWVLDRPLAERERTHQFLRALAARRTSLLIRAELIPTLGVLARWYPQRRRELADWQPRTRNAFGQLASLVRHLFDGYGDVPGWVLEAWATGQLECAGVCLAALTLHLGQGASLRSFPGLPVALTRRQEHYMRQAPAGCTLVEAVRYAQLAERGTLEWLGPVLQTAWGRTPGPDDAFWLGVVDFFAAATLVDPRHFGPVCDWIHHQRTVGIGDEPPQPGFRLKGRSMAAVLALTEQWHRRLAQVRYHGGLPLTTGWTALPVRDFCGGSYQQVLIRQLLTLGELVEEGRALRHCVASYLHSCRKGRCGIFSLTIAGARTLTLEVLRNRTIVQAKGRYNRLLTDYERLWVQRWATEADLSLTKLL